MSRRIAVGLVIAAVAAVAFATVEMLHVRFREDRQQAAPAGGARALVRPHSPLIGRTDAPITIVNFLDPACGSCRASYAAVKEVVAEYPNELRLVVRHVASFRGTDEVLRILELARKQGIYVSVLDAILFTQPEWGDQDSPQLEKAWAAAASAGLDVAAAQKEMLAADVTAALTLDMADIRTLGIARAPAFFVNGKSLPALDVKQLQELVRGQAQAVRNR